VNNKIYKITNYKDNILSLNMLGGGETDAFELKRMMRQEAHEKAFEI
jgi:hypothetical protein